jgi:hypothetical protein
MSGEENGGEENGAGHGGGHGERSRTRRMSLSWREENEAGHIGGHVGGHGDVRTQCHLPMSYALPLHSSVPLYLDQD